ncbi:hypothetical protein [Blastomonas sp. RAC04]|uniref:hypothetical protein n=1 Tax=Blastomonas sp. RAC04 TaxID=1842535 RepID=UPI0012377068|nr:hypothetical protein [Blastomonas sp. RAC04]
MTTFQHDNDNTIVRAANQARKAEDYPPNMTGKATECRPPFSSSDYLDNGGSSVSQPMLPACQGTIVATG